MKNPTTEELAYLADQQAHARSRYAEDDSGLIRESRVIEWALRHCAALRASAPQPTGCGDPACKDAACTYAFEPTDEQINAAAEVMWNDRDARHGGSWPSRGSNEICVIQTRATARAALIAASRFDGALSPSTRRSAGSRPAFPQPRRGGAMTREETP